MAHNGAMRKASEKKNTRLNDRRLLRGVSIDPESLWVVAEQQQEVDTTDIDELRLFELKLACG